MTFDSNMQAIEQDALPELYKIVGGGYEWRYTSYKTDLTFLWDTYVAATIKRSGFSNSKQPGESKVTITFPMAEPIQKYISAYPLPSTSVDIYRAVKSSMSQYALLFSGKVRKATFNNKIISAECWIDDEMSNMLPYVVHQSYCNWQVFDCNCKLEKEDYKVTAVVTVSGNSLISSTFATYAVGHFTQGWVLFQGDMRFITNHAGSQIDLQLSFGSSLVDGSTVYVYPGCDGAAATCIDKYDNFRNWCGMPYIPSHNPALWGFQ